MNDLTLAGNVLGIEKKGTDVMLRLLSNGRRVSLLYRGAKVNVREGDYVWTDIISGQTAPTGEFTTESINVLERSAKIPPVKGKNSSHHQKNPVRLERLVLRSVCEQAISDYMGNHGYLRVSSPAIVGKWPDGNTIPFQVKYYDTDARLSISNMMYQQLMMMQGFGRIYEISKSFRNETPSRPNRLAEFTTFDIGLATCELRDIEAAFEGLIHHLSQVLTERQWEHLELPKSFTFDRISFQELMSRCGLTEMPGAQFPPAVRQYIADNFKSYVWVTGFPKYSRPFYAKAVGEYCEDSQLWYAGRVYIAAASVMEPDSSAYVEKIVMREHNPDHFSDYLSHVRLGIPPIAQLAVGVERMLATWFDDADAADFAWFPRYGKTIPF